MSWPGMGWVLPAMPLIRWMSGTSAMTVRPRSTAAEPVPHRGRGARHQHPHVAHLLIFAVERNARQRIK